ncbi:hypothetical protein COTS27_01676 [Spirochaetota bacterium]|nr:hypothetical protein COTS27_01676 [Spirochaetota bacterium]
MKLGMSLKAVKYYVVPVVLVQSSIANLLKRTPLVWASLLRTGLIVVIGMLPLLKAGAQKPALDPTERPARSEFTYSNYNHDATLAQKYFIQGLGFYNAKSYEVAIRYFFSALQKHSKGDLATIKRSTIRYFLGLAYSKAGYSEEAFTQWQNIQRIETDFYFTDPNDLIEKQNFLARAANLSNPIEKGRPNAYESALGVFANRTNSGLAKLTYMKELSFPNVFKFTLDRVINPGKSYNLITPISLIAHPSKSDLFYVADISTYKIFTLDTYGNYNAKHTPIRIPLIYYPIKRPYDMTVDSDGNLWVTDLDRDQIVHLDTNRKVLNKIGQRGVGSGEFLNPKGVTWGPNETLWVADSGNARLQVFSKDGTWIRSVGKKGSASGEYLYPTRLIYEPTRQYFYVLDSMNNRIQVLDESGIPLYTMGEDNLSTPLDLKTVPHYPQLLLVLDRNNVWLVDTEERRFTPIDLVVRTSVASDDEIETASEVQVDFADNLYRALHINEHGMIYLANGKTGKIDAFNPYEFTSANAYITAERVDTSQFPDIKVEVSVRDPRGRPINGLRQNNFFLAEQGAPQKFLSRELTAEFNRLAVIIEAAPPSFRQTPVITDFFDELMTTLPAEVSVLPVIYGAVSAGGPVAVPIVQRNLDLTNEAAVDPFSQIKVLGGGEFFNNSLKRVLGAALKRTLVDGDNQVLSTTGSLGSFSAPFQSPRSGFQAAFHLAVEKLLPVARRRAIVLVVTTPHFISDWDAPERQNRSPRHSYHNYTTLRDFALANRIPVYTIYSGTSSVSSQELAPLRVFSEGTGGELLYYNTTTAANLLEKLNNHESGQYALYYTTERRPLGKDRFFPLNVRVAFNGIGAQDSWNGFIHP